MATPSGINDSLTDVELTDLLARQLRSLQVKISALRGRASQKPGWNDHVLDLALHVQEAAVRIEYRDLLASATRATNWRNAIHFLNTLLQNYLDASTEREQKLLCMTLHCLLIFNTIQIVCPGFVINYHENDFERAASADMPDWVSDSFEDRREVTSVTDANVESSGESLKESASPKRVSFESTAGTPQETFTTTSSSTSPNQGLRSQDSKATIECKNTGPLAPPSRAAQQNTIGNPNSAIDSKSPVAFLTPEADASKVPAGTPKKKEVLAPHQKASRKQNADGDINVALDAKDLSVSHSQDAPKVMPELAKDTSNFKDASTSSTKGRGNRPFPYDILTKLAPILDHANLVNLLKAGRGMSAAVDMLKEIGVWCRFDPDGQEKYDGWAPVSWIQSEKNKRARRCTFGVFDVNADDANITSRAPESPSYHYHNLIVSGTSAMSPSASTMMGASDCLYVAHYISLHFTHLSIIELTDMHFFTGPMLTQLLGAVHVSDCVKVSRCRAFVIGDICMADDEDSPPLDVLRLSKQNHGMKRQPQLKFAVSRQYAADQLKAVDANASYFATYALAMPYMLTFYNEHPYRDDFVDFISAGGSRRADLSGQDMQSRRRDLEKALVRFESTSKKAVIAGASGPVTVHPMMDEDASDDSDDGGDNSSPLPTQPRQWNLIRDQNTTTYLETAPEEIRAMAQLAQVVTRLAPFLHGRTVSKPPSVGAEETSLDNTLKTWKCTGKHHSGFDESLSLMPGICFPNQPPDPSGKLVCWGCKGAIAEEIDLGLRGLRSSTDQGVAGELQDMIRDVVQLTDYRGDMHNDQENRFDDFMRSGHDWDLRFESARVSQGKTGTDALVELCHSRIGYDVSRCIKGDNTIPFGSADDWVENATKDAVTNIFPDLETIMTAIYCDDDLANKLSEHFKVVGLPTYTGAAGGYSTQSAGPSGSKSTQPAPPAGSNLAQSAGPSGGAPPAGSNLAQSAGPSGGSYTQTLTSAMMSFLGSRPKAQPAGPSQMAGATAPAATKAIRYSDFCVKYLLGQDCQLPSCTKLKSDQAFGRCINMSKKPCKSWFRGSEPGERCDDPHCDLAHKGDVDVDLGFLFWLKKEHDNHR